MKVKELICLLVEEDMDYDVAIQVWNSYEHIDGIAQLYASPAGVVLLVPDKQLGLLP